MQKNIKKDSTMQLQALILFTILITTFQSYAMDSVISSGNAVPTKTLTHQSQFPIHEASYDGGCIYSQALHPFKPEFVIGLDNKIQRIKINKPHEPTTLVTADGPDALLRMLKYNPQATLLAYQSLESGSAGTYVVNLSTGEIRDTDIFPSAFEFNLAGDKLVIHAQTNLGQMTIWDLINETQTTIDTVPHSWTDYISRSCNADVFAWKYWYSDSNNGTVTYDLNNSEVETININHDYKTIFGQTQNELVGYSPSSKPGHVQIICNEQESTAIVENTLHDDLSHASFVYCPQINKYFAILKNQDLNKISINQFNPQNCSMRRIDDGQFFPCYHHDFSPDGSKLLILTGGKTERTIRFYYIDLIELLKNAPIAKSHA
jgi:hypothetical protein